MPQCKQIDPAQWVLISKQLGREPRGLVGVRVSTKNGVPLVLQMHSLVDDKPFPTLFWLSSKTLYQAIATIETAGWVKKIEAELATNLSFRTAYQANQKDYVALRWQLMSDVDQKKIAQLGFTEVFSQYGIGGIRDWSKVRCLHMQYAHHLVVGNNVIGAKLDEEFGLNHLEVEL